MSSNLGRKKISFGFGKNSSKSKTVPTESPKIPTTKTIKKPLGFYGASSSPLESDDDGDDDDGDMDRLHKELLISGKSGKFINNILSGKKRGSESIVQDLPLTAHTSSKKAKPTSSNTTSDNAHSLLKIGGVDFNDLIETKSTNEQDHKIEIIELLENSDKGVGALVAKAAKELKVEEANKNDIGIKTAILKKQEPSKDKKSRTISKKQYGLVLLNDVVEKVVDPNNIDPEIVNSKVELKTGEAEESKYESEPDFDDNDEIEEPLYKIPIQDFGAAMLRGMGWTEGKAVGRADRKDVSF